MNLARRSRLSFLLLALAMSGCATAVDGEGTSSSSAALSGTGDACESSPLTCSAPATELTSDEDEYQLSIDSAQTQLADSTCRRVCACCARNGNRFCCSHCRFCSGPIGVSERLAL